MEEEAAGEPLNFEYNLETAAPHAVKSIREQIVRVFSRIDGYL